MMIPMADEAVIAKDKLCDYLLNPVHRRGGSKARLLFSMGYSGDDWQQMESDCVFIILPLKLIARRIRTTGSAMRLSPHCLPWAVAGFYSAAFGKSTLVRTFPD